MKKQSKSIPKKSATTNFNNKKFMPIIDLGGTQFRKRIMESNTIEKKNPVDNIINESLIDAAARHQLDKVRELIQMGANVNYIRYTGSDAWYKGNSHTALYEAVHKNFEDQYNYLGVIEQLLKNGANPNFKAVRGGWNHASQYPIFSNSGSIISKLSSDNQRIRFLQMFVKHGIDINQKQMTGRDKNFKSYQNHTCFLFQMLYQCHIPSKIYQLKQPIALHLIQQMRKQREEQLKNIFYKQKNIKRQQNNQKQQDKNAQQAEKKPANQYLIKQIIKLGADPNSYQYSDRWQNYNIHMYGSQDQKYAKYQTTYNTVYQTVLHRAIMNKLPELVKFLVEKGANVGKKCKYTSSKLLYPNEWPQRLKQIKMNQNLQNLKYWQQQRKVSQQKGENDKKYVLQCEYNIYKAQRYQTQNQLPLATYENKQISCVQLAKRYNLPQAIIQLLQRKQLQIQKQKQEMQKELIEFQKLKPKLKPALKAKVESKDEPLMKKKRK